MLKRDAIPRVARPERPEDGSMVDRIQLQRLAAQVLRTDRLIGVDFAPRRLAESMLAAVESADLEIEEPGRGASQSVIGRGSSDGRTHRTAEAPAVPTASPDAPRPRVEIADRARRFDGSRTERLAALREEHDRACPHCTVATAHTQTVFGDGDPEAELVFVGEAPGEREDQVGRPFVGRAGQKLDEIIAAMGLLRESVYIANVLKSRPPDNRTPLRHEVEACGPYLQEQIRIIEPKVIVTLGGPATKLLLGVETGITKLRGVWASYRVGDIEIPVMPTFHPAYLLRNYTPQTRKQVWSDMQQVCERLGIEPKAK